MNTPREQASTTDGRSTTNYTRRGARLALAAALGAATLGVSVSAGAQAVTQVCQSHQWVGTASGCPAVAGWNLNTITTSATSDYCVYTWTLPTTPQVADIQVLAGVPGLQDLTEDCLVVYPQSSPTPSYDQQVADVLRANLRDRVRDGSLPIQPPARARVVVIDTAPDAPAGAIPIGNDPHGYTLAHLIEDIACQGPSCAAEVTTALALPWDTWSSQDLVNGGYLGTRTDLAKAIVNATNQWLNDGALHNLILNLSVGWEDLDSDCSKAPTKDLPSRAVYEAIHDAAAAGALIIAAAGNNTWGPWHPPGLLYPGCWQELPGPGQNQLLLAAAYGVDHRDRPLTTARPQSTTAFAGTAQGGVAWAQGAPLPPALTGSSVAAADLSAVSALVWAFDPTLGAADVLDVVHRGAEYLGTAASCPWTLGSGCDARRISACGALSKLGLPLSCQDSVPQALPALPQGTPPQQPPQQSQWSSGATLPNDSYRSPESQAAVFPQPIYPTCPTCVVTVPVGSTSNPIFYGTLGATLNNPTLVIQSSGNELSVSLRPTSVPMYSNTTYALSLPPLVGVSVDSAYLTGDDGQFSYTSQILIRQ